jgi:hypothetical protein
VAPGDDPISFSRTETIDILPALESAAYVLQQIGRAEDVLVIFEVEEAAALVTNRLWPDDGEV